MIRKRILISIFALATSLVSPFVSAELLPVGKLILGMDIGYASRSGDLNSNYHVTATRPGAFALLPVGTALNSVTPKLSDSGTVLGLLGGYELQWRDFFGGIEGHIEFGRYEQAKQYHFSNANPVLVGAVGAPVQFIAEATYIQGTRYGASFRFGMDVPPMFKPYVRVGGEYSDHEVSITNTFTAALPLPWDHFSEKKGLWTWLLGAGIEIPLLSDLVGIRAEYNYLPGTHFGFNDNIDTLGASHDIKVKTHRGKLAIVVNLD